MKKIAVLLERYIITVLFIGFLMFLLGAFVFRFSNTTWLVGVMPTPYPPNISVDTILDGTYQSSFSRWLSDNFYKHTEIVKCHNQIEYGIFQDGVGDWIQGKDDYLFSKSQTYTYAGGDRANANSYEQYLEYASTIAEVQALLQEDGKDFIFLITPIKAEIYPEYIPWYEKMILKRYGSGENSTRKMLIRALEERGVNYYDVTQDLVEMRKNKEFDVYSKTGQHWTLTAAATEMKAIMEQFEKLSAFTEYPRVNIVDIKEELFGIDKDILDLQNVIYPNVADKYTSPLLEMIRSNDSAFLFGTSFGWEIAGSFYVNEKVRAWDELVYQEYFVNLTEYGEEGDFTQSYSSNNTPDDLGVMKHINNSNVIIMEQQAQLGIMETHKKFIDYVNEQLKTGYYTMSGDLLRNKTAYSQFDLVNFYDLEDWGRWTKGNDCTVSLYDDIVDIESPLFLKMRVGSFAYDQMVDVYLNGKCIDTINVSQEKQDYLLELPHELIEHSENKIKFVLSEETTSPAQWLYTNDDRNLGLGFEELTIVAGGNS